MSILNVIGMIPKGGRYAKSVVNFVRKAPENWPKFKEAIQQIDDLLKQGKLKLDGKQKTIFESNKNILKNHEKVTKEKVKQDDVTKKMWEKRKEYPPFNTSKEDFTKGWKPTVIERQNLRNIYKDKLNPPERLYTKEMEAIDETLDDLMIYGKYDNLSSTEKAAMFKKLQADMKKLIDIAKKEDPTKLSLSQINKKSQDLQKRIREIANDPNIKGTVTEGPKKDMIAAIYDSEHAALSNAKTLITKKNSELKYGKKYPVLDPENDAFIVIGLDEFGHPIKMGRFTGKFSATKDKTGELTSSEGTSFYDKWNAKTGTMRKEGEEVFHETLNREGKTIMSNPEYKIPKTQRLDIQTEFYTDLSTNDLAKKGFQLKQIDMIKKGREVLKYLKKTESPDVNIRMHEQTSTNEIGAVMEDLYNRGDDVYKMSMEEWITKIPKYFAGGGRVPGFATGGISNLFRQRQGFQDGTTMDLKYINPAFDTSEGMLSGVGGFPIVPAAVSGIALALSQKDKDKKVPQKKEGPKLPDPKPPFKIGDLIIDFIVANRRQPTPSEELRLKEILRVAKEKYVSKDRKLTKDELDDLYEEFDEAVPYPMETVGDKEKFLKDVKDEEAYMFQQYKMGKLDPMPGDKSPARKRFLEKKLEEMELSGDKRLMTREEIEELSSFDLGTEMDEAIKKSKTLTPEEELRKEFPGIDDRLIKNILADTNPQRIAEVKQTMREYLKLREVGKSEQEAYDIITKAIKKPTKHATGGLIGYATGGVSNLFRRR